MNSKNHPLLSQAWLQAIHTALLKPHVILSLALSFVPSLTFAQNSAPSFLRSPVVIFTPTLLSSADAEFPPQLSDFPSVVNTNIVDQPDSSSSTTPLIENTKSATNLKPINEYIQAVSDSETSDNSYNIDLIEALDALAFAYRQYDEPELAIEAYKRAIHIARINQGLNGSEQNTLIESLSETLIETGNLAEASAQQEYLLHLRQQQNPNNFGELLQASIDYADWNLSLATNAFHFKLTDSYDFLIERLYVAKFHYSTIIPFSPSAFNSISGSGTLSNKLVQANYYLAYYEVLKGTNRYHDGPWSNGPHEKTGKEEGIQILVSNLDFVKRQGNSDIEQTVRAMLDLADWCEIYKEPNVAKELYTEAYTMLQQSGIAYKDALLTEFFHPPLPQKIPAFIPADHSSQAYHIAQIQPKDVLGYIDVSFRVDRTAQTGKIKILDISPGLDTEYQEALKYDISQSRYRTRYEDGKPVREIYTLRYYVSSVN